MKQIQFSKELLSIDKIGLLRFWIGLCAGILTAITLSLFFNYSRETLRLLTLLSADLIILGQTEYIFYNRFFAALSTVLGLSITIWIWMSHRPSDRKKGRFFSLLAQMNALLIFWVVLLIVSRFSSTLTVIVYGNEGYDNHFDLYNNFWWMLIMLPTVVFAQNWYVVRMIYKTGKWILYSFLFCLILSWLLSITTKVNQESLNEAYTKMFEIEYEYLQNLISYAKSNYGIQYADSTIYDMKRWHSEGAVQQVQSIKYAFAKDEKISMDTILLQRMIIHNCKRGPFHPSRDVFDNWYYALPKDILKQIRYYKPADEETKELFYILKEEIKLANAKERKPRSFTEYSRFEFKRSLYAKHSVTSEIVKQLKTVKDSLCKSQQYHEHCAFLPKIKVN